MIKYDNKIYELRGVGMFYTKDHKTLNMFDPLEHLGPRRRKLLGGSWAHLFRVALRFEYHRRIG